MKNKLVKTMLIVIAVLTCLLASVFSAEEFCDVPNNAWYAECVDYITDHGYMNGIDKSHFAPDETVTRGMVVTILYRVAGSPQIKERCTFSDIPDGAYYEIPVSWASSQGIVNGYSEDVFAPNDQVNREQIATILFRYSYYMGINIVGGAEYGEYKDQNSISDYAIEAMKWANTNGLITGISETLLSPKGTATRAQVAMIIMRYNELVESIKRETVDTEEEVVEMAEATQTDEAADTTETTESEHIKDDEVCSNGNESPDISIIPTIEVDSVYANAGDETVAVPIRIKGNPGIASIGIIVECDEYLTLSSVEYNASLCGQVMHPQQNSSPVHLTWISPFENVFGDWIFATLFFSISENAIGTHPIFLSYDEENIYNLSEENIHFDVEQGCIIIK